jgi:hypothetical protein
MTERWPYGHADSKQEEQRMRALHGFRQLPDREKLSRFLRELAVSGSLGRIDAQAWLTALEELTPELVSDLLATLGRTAAPHRFDVVTQLVVQVGEARAAERDAGRRVGARLVLGLLQPRPRVGAHGDVGDVRSGDSEKLLDHGGLRRPHVPVDRRHGQIAAGEVPLEAVLGVHCLAWDEAQKIAGKDPDFNRRDMWESIAAGQFFEYDPVLPLRLGCARAVTGHSKSCASRASARSTEPLTIPLARNSAPP